MNETIFALSSGHGKSGVAVIRISGNDLQNFFEKTANLKSGIKERYAYLIDLKDTSGELVDKCIAIYFRAPHSFTGNDVVEIQSHGSEAVIQKIFEVLKSFGFRMADKGEFSRRAFQNGKMDLVDIEGLSALIDARTDRQREQALRIMTGGDTRLFEKWRSQMIDIAAYSAAVLDYASDDLPQDIWGTLIHRVRQLCNEISCSLRESGATRKICSGFSIVLAGPTNVGKSSLFNKIIGQSRAIVSDIHGTTRDVVTSELDIDGYLVRLADTAGLRKSKDAIEKIGMVKTNFEIDNADLVLRVYTGKKAPVSDKENEIIICNKCDIENGGPGIHVSAITGQGFDELMNVIKQKIHEQMAGAESDIVINERVKSHLIKARDELEEAVIDFESFDIFAERVRIAAGEMGQILGIIGTDEVLDAVFGQLCLGK